MTIDDGSVQPLRLTAYVIFRDGTRVAVEVADTDEARARGLMFRDSIGDEEGMLFPFDAPRRYGFWMKNVRFPLDIIWLGADGSIVWIAESAKPCDVDPCPMYLPPEKASFVVEVPGGFARRHGVSVGDVVTITRRS